MTNKEIGLRIENRRRELDYTLDYVASKIGVAKSTIQRYEKGQIQKIKLPVIESIAGVLNVDPNWIIGKNENPEPISANSPSAQELTEGEAALLELFRQVPEDRQDYVLEMIRLAVKI